MQRNGTSGRVGAVSVGWWVVCVLGVVGLAPGDAFALPTIDSSATAVADEYGDDPGIDEDTDQTSSAGATADAYAYRCPGDVNCVLQPDAIPVPGARGRASTDFGSNSAWAVARSGYDLNAQNDVLDYADASSLWTDEWTFSVAPTAVGSPVSVEIALDGSWHAEGLAHFGALIADSTLPTPPPGEGEPPPLVEGQPVTFVGFDTTASAAFDGIPPFFVPVPDGGLPDGDASLTLTLRFVPEPDRMYGIGARLFTVGGETGLDDSEADFGSTATVTRVLVPEGVSFTAASGASWNVVTHPVPEPSVALLCGAALATLTWVRRHERR